MTELWKLPAHALATSIRNREVSSRELVQVLVERIERLNKHINAFALIDSEGALEAADAADAANARGDHWGPLHGIPVTVKDLVPTAGMRTAFGSHVFSENVPEKDAEAVSRLRNAGAIILGKTTTPEFGHKVLTDSPLHGITRNPWSLEHTSGGSSGGAAAGVAMGFGQLALSTDGAGSGRIPAACCGIVGLKPTMGAVPHETAPDLFGSLTCIGPMGRTVEDVVLLYNAMHGPDNRDPWSLAGSTAPLALPEDRLSPLKDLRVRWMSHTVNAYIDPQTKALCTQAVQKMEEAGAHLVDSPLDIDWGLETALTLMRGNQAARFGHLLKQWREMMDPTMVLAVEEGLAQGVGSLQQALQKRTALFHEIQAVFDDADVLVTPTVATPALPAKQRADEPLAIDGKSVGSLRNSWYCYTIPFNPSGNPAISIPCGYSDNGLPVGLQIVAPWHAEQRLVSIAGALSELMPWNHSWPATAAEETKQ